VLLPRRTAVSLPLEHDGDFAQQTIPARRPETIDAIGDGETMSFRVRRAAERPSPQDIADLLSARSSTAPSMRMPVSLIYTRLLGRGSAGHRHARAPDGKKVVGSAD